MAEIITNMKPKLERCEFNKGIREAKRDIRELIFTVMEARKQIKNLVKTMKGCVK